MQFHKALEYFSLSVSDTQAKNLNIFLIIFYFLWTVSPLDIINRRCIYSWY